MADEEYNKKLESLQQYIPFLNNMIAQLKDPRKKNREQQLAKMVSLHSMITDKKKKLKLETLTKCEDVILKLYEKVKSGSHSQAPPSNARPPPSNARPPPSSARPPPSNARPAPSNARPPPSNARLPLPAQAPITPSSPSPPRDVLKTRPVVIPTEKVPERSSTYKPIIDIYSSAADSLMGPSQAKPSVFERLGRRGPELSKPPISMEDLEALQQDVYTERMSLNELTHLREKLQDQLKTDDTPGQAINTTVRNTTILTKKAVEKGALEKTKPAEVKPVAKSSPGPSKPVKVVKDSSSIFGSTLSSIDNQIIDVKDKKGKEKERRSSKEGSRKEPSDTEKKEHKSSKDKTDKKSSDKKDDDRREKSKDRKDDKDRRSKDDHKKHDKKDHHHDKDRKKEDHDKDRKKEDKPKERVKDKPKEEKRKEEEKPKEQPKPVEAPVYKRLADKYNPKPRKPPQTESTDITKKVSESIESTMKTTPLPLLDFLPKSPPPNRPLSTLPLPVPLSSPASSTSTLDNEVANFSRKPLLPTPAQTVPLLPQSLAHLTQPVQHPPQPVPHPTLPNLQSLPAQLSNILANPNTTALINSVVNQFKGGRQTPLCPPTPNAYAHLGVNQGNTRNVPAPIAGNQRNVPTPIPGIQHQRNIPTPIPGNQHNIPNPILGNQHQRNIPTPIPGNQHNAPTPIPGNQHQRNIPTPIPGNQHNMPTPNKPNFQNNYQNEGHFNQGGNFWPNQQQQHHPRQNQNFTGPQQNQNFSAAARSFTPMPTNNQYDQMQTMDYYPSGSAAPSHSYPQQAPPLLSPQYDNYERPQQRQNNESKERGDGGRYREDWRRLPATNQRGGQSQGRDPRLAQRDPRYRDDARSSTPAPRRDSREYDRDDRGKFRDPRLNRFRYDRDRDRDREREQARTPRPKRESDETTTTTTTTTNNFVSPLDSLYSGSEGYRKTGKGYGMQNFKIPKIKKDEEVEEVVEKKEKAKEEVAEVEKKEEVVEVVEEKDKVPEVKEEEKETVEAEPEPKKPEPKASTSVEATEVDEAKETSVSSSTECDSKETIENEPEVTKEPAEIGEISSTNDMTETQSRDTPKPMEDESQDIINKFLKKLLENERTRAAASLFIDNVSNSLDDEKLKMVVQTVKSATVEEEGGEAEEEQEEEEEEEEEEEPEKPRPGRKKRLVKKKLNAKVTTKKRQMRKRWTLKRRKQATKVIEDDEEEEQVEEKEVKEEVPAEVVVSVGERIKSRKRQAASPKRKKFKHKTELDLLHEDIQDMFIRDGVLTATGKRMCRLLKTDNEPKVPVSPEPKRRTRNSAEKFDPKANSDKLKAMSNVRVLIPKMSADQLAEIDDENQRYSLRRASKSTKNYAEVDSEDERQREVEREKEKKLEREREKAEEKRLAKEEEKRLAKEEEKRLAKEEEKRLAKEEEKRLAKEEEKRLAKEEAEKTAVKSQEDKDKEKLPPPKKAKKRGNAWASGVIPKYKRKKPSGEKEELDKSVELVEPDRNYFSSKLWHQKTHCKLCDYDGGNIARHYRIKHPESEVLSSRLSPQKAEEAMKRSAELKLDEREGDAARGGFQPCVCRFCDLVMHCQSGSFYDHLSTHTGEFRHTCASCSFSASSTKGLRSHHTKLHPNEPLSKLTPVRRRIYGYICTECNFVQMTKKTVENHVNVYHLGEGEKVMRIHLSVLDDKDKEEGEEDAGEPKAKKKKPNAEQSDEEPSPKKVADRPIKKEKEIDMTVFTCNTNIQEENQKIEEERLQKMAELAESVNTKRQSLNFVNQLSNRLLQEEKEEDPPAPELVTVKSEPVDDLIPELEPEVPEPELTFAEPIVEVTTPVTPKKPTKVIEPVAASGPVVEKDTSIIQGMIQKLQGILKEEKTDGPPPLAPLVEKIEEGKAFISAGFLNISKTANGLEYACRVPSCLFTSTNRDSFVLHWKEDHTRINQSYKLTKCRICQDEVKAGTDSTLLLTFFAHVENEHLCGIRTSFNAGLISIDKDREGYEYICRVSMCIFITKNRESFVAHLNDHTLVDGCKSTKCGICQGLVSATVDSDLLINLFSHIESEHLEEDKPPKVNVLRTRRLSGDKLSTATTTKEESPELKESEENPFPFKISGVMSLADETVPPLSPIRDNKPSPQKVESVILKEAKMNSMEKAVTWKCAEAIKKFLTCPRELYKCPQFFCKYATSWRHLFENHIKAHARINDELVCCVYCDIKTPLSHSGLHIDLRHSNCLYSCSQCLYRALTREYVAIHNRLKHKEGDLVVALPPKTAKTIMMSKQKRYTVKEACQPYRCGYQSCVAQFLFLNEFIAHLQKRHDGIMMCGYLNNQQQRCSFQCLVVENMIDHWRTHSCYHYHCLLCKVGCMEMYSMLEHYSITHPNMDPIVVDRRNSPKNTTLYGYTDDAAFKVRYLKDELLESVNVQHVTMVGAPPPEQSEPPKPQGQSVTLVPLSVFQSNPNEAKKIIAIIPNTKVITSSAAVPGAAAPAAIFTAPQSKPSPSTSTPFIFASTEDAAKDDDKEEEELIKEADGAEGDVSGDLLPDPLCLDGEMVSAGDESDSTELNDGNEMKSFGLIGYQLYRCSFCDISFSNARDFKAHTMHSKQCRDTACLAKPYKCVHCQRLFKNPHGLLEHVQYHGQLRFGCSLCVKKFPSSFSLKVHMRGKHNVTNTVTTPLAPNKTNLDRDEFILRPIPTLENEIDKDGSKIPTQPGQKCVYGPDEIDQLPKPYIFKSDIKCALCSYATKVRTNLVRHLQFHSSEKSVPDIAPVNPVPCLDKNEKMFDKMTNLAISSFSGSRMGGVKQETKVVKEEETLTPAYVPSHRRYVCCADGCNYLCLEESNLRHHLHALHAQEPSFICFHCKMGLKTDIEVFLKHLKLHDLHLYKCSECAFVHKLRHKVGKHATDRHPERAAHTITIRALEAEPVDAADQSAAVAAPAPPAGDAPIAPNIKWTKPWHCGMCKYRCAAKSDILAHIFNKHDISAQFKCTLCSYKTDEKATFEGHFKDSHPDNDIDIIYVYYKSEGAGQQAAATNPKFDTTPLWQRDRPRVRHIRGILFEETSGLPAKTKKTAMARLMAAAAIPQAAASSSTTTTNLDLAIDAVAKGLEEVATTMMRNCQPEAAKPTETVTRPPTETLDGVIVIDDDDDDEDQGEVGRQLLSMMSSSRFDESADNLMIDELEGESPTVKKEAATKGLLTDELLYEKYGSLCMPLANAFKCPLCTKYRHKKIESFVHHVLTEMKCHRFRCSLCEHVSLTTDAMSSHCQERHNSAPDSNVVETPIEKTVEYWLQNLIRHQSKHIVQQISPPLGEPRCSAGTRIQCEHCSKWFKTVGLLKDHELYHWAQHSYRCAHCSADLDGLDELFQHTFLAHAAYDVSFTTNGPYVGEVIGELKPPQGGAALPGTPPPEDRKYTCLYCSESGRSLEMLKTHVQECHEGEEFRYKVVAAKNKVDFHCCGYCHERGTEEVIRSHHKEKHGGLELNIYQYICLECSRTFSNIKELRAHFICVHQGKKLTYSCIENKPGGSGDYACTKCPFRSGALGVMRSHLKKHLKPVDCLTCGATFIYPTEGRAHHAKEHPDVPESVEDNKDKLKEYEDLVGKITMAWKERCHETVPKPAAATVAAAPPAPAPRKMLARKSTGAPFIRERKDDPADQRKVGND